MSKILQNLLDPSFIPPEKMPARSMTGRQSLDDFKASHKVDAMGALTRHAAQQPATVTPIRRQNVRPSFGGRERVAA